MIEQLLFEAIVLWSTWDESDAKTSVGRSLEVNLEYSLCEDYGAYIHIEQGRYFPNRHTFVADSDLDRLCIYHVRLLCGAGISLAPPLWHLRALFKVARFALARIAQVSNDHTCRAKRVASILCLQEMCQHLLLKPSLNTSIAE